MAVPTNHSPLQSPQLPDYTILETLHIGLRVVVYRAFQKSQQRSVVIKMLRSEHPSFNELVQFHNQYTIAKKLPITGIVHPLSLELIGNHYVLVMEDWDAISLDQCIQQHPLDLAEILKIALQLAEILHNLHQHRVIHKNINPANLLIQPESQQIRLIDFSIASLLAKETQEIQNPNRLEGTLAYLAPEQTGRMNRGIDYRADYYSLGIMLYQLLAGRLPCDFDDPLEMVHCHIATIPAPVNRVNPDIPTMVEAIVAKLMAKNPEDRYQSASGLHTDLEQCLSQWETTGFIADFELDQRDLNDRFLIPDKLYGRQAEVQTLLSAFERVAAGASEFMLVVGFSGIGKTGVVNEIHQPITRQYGYFIQGKFDQLNHNIPLSAFVQALRDLIGQVLSESDQQLAHWKSQILDVVGENGQVLIDVIPELEHIIGPQPIVASDLSGIAAQNRFNRLLQQFIQRFATADHPLVIFLDDLQWADAASLQLIQVLMQGSSYFFLLGAYRDNEVFPTHPLMLTIRELAQTPAIVQTMTLTPLTLEDTNQLIADTLHCSPALAKPLTELVNRKTQGNPFFTTQFLKALYEAGQIQFNAERRHWECDIAQVTALSLTNDVVELMVCQIQKLPQETQDVLKLAACIGNQFDLNTLAITSERSITDTANLLWKALQEGLILPISEIYKFLQSTGVNLQSHTRAVHVPYRFLHDRIQQAAYSLISETDKPVVHRRIGQLLLQNLTETDRENRLFDIVNHLNLGSVLPSTVEEQEQLAHLNLAAGRKAKLATAYEAAIAYCEKGLQLLPTDAWESHYSLTLTLHEEITDACYLNSDFEGLERWATIVCQRAKNLFDTIKVQLNRIIGTNVQGNLSDALQIGLALLRSLEIEFPDQPTSIEIEQAFHDSQLLWADRSIGSLIDLPPLTDPHLIAKLEVLSMLSSTAYLVAPTLMPLLIFKQIEITIQFGNSPISVFAYGDYGVILCGMMGKIEQGYEFGELALSLRDRFQLSSFKSRNWFVAYFFIKHWRDPLSQVVPALEQAYQSGLESGDLEAANLSAASHCAYAYYQGQPLPKLLPKINAYRQLILQHQHIHCLFLQSVYQQMVMNLLGESQSPDRLTGEFFDAATILPLMQAQHYRSGAAHWYIHQAILYYLFDKPEEAAQASIQATQYIDGCLATVTCVLHIWFDALIQLNQSSNATPEERQRILLQVQQQQDKLHHWATFAPANHQHRWELVTAEYYRVLDNKAAAIDYYDQAIASAKANHFIQDEAIANELAAKFYLNWGKEKIAACYMQIAYDCYRRWGAKAKTQDLIKRYPDLLTPMLDLADEITTESINRNRESTIELSAALDLNTVLRANQTLSREIHLEKLLQNLIHLVITNAGAEKAVLFLQNNGCLEAGINYFDRAFHPVKCQSIDQCCQVPLVLVHYVERTLETVITDFQTHISTLNDPYCHQFKPKSLLCTPILNQGQLVGVLYLENAITYGVFTNERVELLKLLCAQAAISLVNARLYEQSQSYAQQLERSLQDLSLSEARFQTLAENMPGAIFKLAINLDDGSVSILYISSGCYTLCGVSADAFLAGEYNLRDFEHVDDRDRILETVRHSAAQNTSFHEEFRIITLSGEMKWIHIAAQPKRQADGQIIWDGLLMDISDRKQYEEKLEKNNGELIRATRMKDEFLATMSHELRTPLNSILGMTEGLQEEIFGAMNHKQLQALQTIEHSGTHLLQLISDILDFSQITSGQVTLDYASIAIDQVCRESLAFIQTQAAKKLLQVESQIPPDLPHLWLDEDRIRQVLTNLLINAVKFTPEGGKITLEVQPAAVSGDRKMLKINVRDTGIGIAEANLDKLFRPFIQIDSALNRQYEGTGLGLVMVKSLVELHGGEVTVSSQVGIGSCFTIALPYVRTDAAFE